MRMWLALFVGLLILGGCDARRPASSRTVAAYEVPLFTASDRTEFLDLVSREASQEGLHLDATSDDDLKRMPIKKTMWAAVWRGTEDDQCEAVIGDAEDHLGLVWITFLRGEDPELASKFRDQAMSKILARWPETLSLPVMPTGAIPNHYALRKTPTGYKLDPAYVSLYGVDASSPLVAQP